MAPLRGATGIGPVVTDFRARTGLSQADIARHLGVNRGFVSRVESGARRPAIDTIRRIMGHQQIDGDEIRRMLVSAFGPAVAREWTDTATPDTAGEPTDGRRE